MSSPQDDELGAHGYCLRDPADVGNHDYLHQAYPNLRDFSMGDLGQFVDAKLGGPPANPDSSEEFLLMFAGRDNIHEALKHVLGGVRQSLYLNMFGFDDPELNDLLMKLAVNPGITMLITLDKSQAGGVHERALIQADEKFDLKSFNTHFVIGQSATHQISHTKGFVADTLVGGEGSTNWSTAGEGTFIVKGPNDNGVLGAGGPGYKAQNNTQTFFTDPYSVARFQAELIKEHMEAQANKSKP